MNPLSDAFKKIYFEETGLDSDKSLSWVFDSVNHCIYDNKLMNTYKVVARKFGMKSQGNEEGWGLPGEIIVSEDELTKLKNNPNEYEIISAELLKNEWYSALIAKITSKGKRVDAKNFFYSPGKYTDGIQQTKIWKE